MVVPALPQYPCLLEYVEKLEGDFKLPDLAVRAHEYFETAAEAEEAKTNCKENRLAARCGRAARIAAFRIDATRTKSYEPRFLVCSRRENRVFLRSLLLKKVSSHMSTT